MASNLWEYIDPEDRPLRNRRNQVSRGLEREKGSPIDTKLAGSVSLKGMMIENMTAMMLIASQHSLLVDSWMFQLHEVIQHIEAANNMRPEPYAPDTEWKRRTLGGCDWDKIHYETPLRRWHRED